MRLHWENAAPLLGTLPGILALALVVMIFAHWRLSRRHRRVKGTLARVRMERNELRERQLPGQLR